MSTNVVECVSCGRETIGGYGPEGICSICDIHRIEDKEFLKHVEWAVLTINVETIAKGLGLSGKSETNYDQA